MDGNTCKSGCAGLGGWTLDGLCFVNVEFKYKYGMEPVSFHSNEICKKMPELDSTWRIPTPVETCKFKLKYPDVDANCVYGIIISSISNDGYQKVAQYSSRAFQCYQINALVCDTGGFEGTKGSNVIDSCLMRSSTGFHDMRWDSRGGEIEITCVKEN